MNTTLKTHEERGGEVSSTIHYSLFAIRSRRGFTLVELLTVIVIITILAGISMFALTGSYEEAKIVKTRGTIQKLDAAIQTIFEGYEEKFDAINLPRGVPSSQRAAVKLHFIHDLMRMEMPTHWREIVNAITGNKIGPIDITVNSTNYHVDEPAVLNYYYKAYQNAITVNPAGTENGPAELLYLIIANLNPEALEGFGGSEIGDTDGNGALEFLDGWGRPIFFIRAAAGMADSAKQPNVVGALTLGTGYNDKPTTNANYLQWTPLPKDVNNTDWASPPSTLVTAYKNAVTTAPDPFDMTAEVANRRSWFLYPVIVSAGPDGIFDLAWGEEIGGSPTNHALKSPSTSDDVNPFNFPSGIPEDKAGSGVLHHYDNIHNHRQSGGF